MIFDTHAHYDDKAFDEDRESLLASFSEAGISRVINSAADPDSFVTTPKLAEQYDFIYAALGLHPDEVGYFSEETFAELEKGLSHPKVVAVGEIGLDYHWMTEPKEVQEKWLVRQLDLARNHHLPVIIHSRDAAADTMEILKREDIGSIGGVMHCYSYSVDQAREYASMGLFFGIGGTVTFKNARKVREVVAEIPLSQLLLETDCPYLAPDPHRGTRNSSLYLPYVVKKIAEIKDCSEETVVKTTYENACRLFGLS